MCVVKAPKIKNPTPTGPGRDKPLPVLTNSILDGIDPTTNALRIGRSSLRIDRNPASGPSAATTPRASVVSPLAGLRMGI